MEIEIHLREQGYVIRWQTDRCNEHFSTVKEECSKTERIKTPDSLFLIKINLRPLINKRPL